MVLNVAQLVKGLITGMALEHLILATCLLVVNIRSLDAFFLENLLALFGLTLLRVDFLLRNVHLLHNVGA